MNTLIDTIKYFLLITIELTVLFIGISTFVALVLMNLPEDKIKRWMSGKGVLGNVVGAFFGALTPFCACSTIPMTLGFLKIGIPFGVVMSFVIASPLLNPIIIGMMAALMGIKITVVYFLVTFIGAVIFGLILEKTGWSHLVKNVRLKSGGSDKKEKIPPTFKEKIVVSFSKAWTDFRGVLIYLLIGVGLERQFTGIFRKILF